MGRMEGKVVLVTGGARGQGRAHCLRQAEEGADIVFCDLAEQLPTVPYPMSEEADIEATRAAVEALDRHCLAVKADVRDADAMEALVAAALERYGRIDAVIANAGIAPMGTWDERDDAALDDVIAVNTMGAVNVVRAAVPQMIERGEGGAIVITASSCALEPVYGMFHYDLSKFAVNGAAKNLAAELAPHMIRVNSIAPGLVKTPMTMNATFAEAFTGRPDPSDAERAYASEPLSLLPTPWLEPVDIANAALFLACEESRYVTGLTLSVDLGQTNQPAGIPPVGYEMIAAASQPDRT
jgi:SDR family mycofactocin-dependent oxidoreductase